MNILLRFTSSAWLLLLMVVSTSRADTISNLKAYWPFTQGSGADASGNGFAATLSNTTPVDDRYAAPSSALSFNGSNSSAEVAPTFAMTNQQTYSAWIKPAAIGATHPIFEKAVPGYGGEIDMMMFVQADGRVYWAVNTDDGVTGQFAQTTSTTILTTGQWYSIVGVIDQALNEARLYINGVLEDSATMGERNVRNTNRPLRVGRRIGNQATQSFNGAIDEVRVYDRALTMPDIAGLLNPLAGYEQTWVEDFEGTALAPGVWTLRSGDSAVVSGGTAKISSSLNWSGIVSSSGKKTISGNDFMIEFRARRLGSYDLALALTDGTNSVTCMESNYPGNNGLVLATGGDFGSSLQTNGLATESWKEYRLICKGNLVTLQRGDSLTNLPETLSKTLSTSFSGHTLYLSLNNGGQNTAEFDWIKVYGPSVVTPVLVDVYGGGRHGDYTVATNMTIEQLYLAVRLPTDPALYNPADANAVPHFRNLTIANNAVLSASPWDGTKGGNVTFKVQGVLAVGASASISVNGLGYVAGPGAGNAGAAQYNNGYGNYTYYGGGGGGFGSDGATGPPWPFPHSASGGGGGASYGDSALTTSWLGSGGGISGKGYAGGRGAGSIRLSVARLALEGTITADGAEGNGGGSYASNGNQDGNFSGGGGGSGGGIKIEAISGSFGTSRVTARGGIGGLTSMGTSNAAIGGAGGNGRIRVELANGSGVSAIPTSSTVTDTSRDQDGDGIPDWIEWNNTDLNTTRDRDADGIFDYKDDDSDADGIPDSIEKGLDGFNPTSTDPDGFANYIDTDSDEDGVLDSVERGPDGLHPRDTDGDLKPDYIDTDSDENGIPDSIQLGVNGLQHSQDTDMDGMPDFWETFYGLNPTSAEDAGTHLPGDSLSFIQRFQFNLSGATSDADGDGISDADELFVYGTQARGGDSDGDGMPDAWESANGLNLLANDANLDADGDGLTNAKEYNSGVSSTNPRSPDSDANGVSDYEQRNGAKFIKHRYDRNDRLITTAYNNGAWEGWRYDGNGNILRHLLRAPRDADNDGLADAWEFAQGLAFDSSTGTQGFGGDADGDGWTNQQEFLADTAANDATSIPSTGTGSTAWASPPKSRIVFPAASGGALAHVSVRLWDAEANRAQAALQWWDSAANLWKTATLSKVNNGSPAGATSLTTTPAGTTHDFLWNALADIPAHNGSILLRTTSQDAAGTTTSETVPYALNTAGDFDSDGIPDTYEIANGLDPNSATGNDGTTGDGDQDGFNNFAEFAFHMNLNQSNVADGPAMSKAINPADGKDYLTFTYRRRLDAAALNMTYTVQTSTDLGIWTSNIADIEPISTTPTGDGVTETVTVRIKPPMDTPNMKKFVRVQVTK